MADGSQAGLSGRCHREDRCGLAGGQDSRPGSRGPARYPAAERQCRCRPVTGRWSPSSAAPDSCWLTPQVHVQLPGKQGAGDERHSCSIRGAAPVAILADVVTPISPSLLSGRLRPGTATDHSLVWNGAFLQYDRFCYRCPGISSSASAVVAAIFGFGLCAETRRCGDYRTVETPLDGGLPATPAAGADGTAPAAAADESAAVRQLDGRLRRADCRPRPRRDRTCPQRTTSVADHRGIPAWSRSGPRWFSRPSRPPAADLRGRRGLACPATVGSPAVRVGRDGGRPATASSHAQRRALFRASSGIKRCRLSAARE